MRNEFRTGQRGGQEGNVLFLILIAVALFAALSYAVTQSSRSGGGDASSETNLINSAQITQYPSSVRTAIVRMIINGVDVTGLEFNAPSDFAGLTETPSGSDRFPAGVFHPTGGGATYTEAPKDVMASSSQGTWHFNMEFEIENIGTAGDGSDDGNEIIAFLPGISKSVCDRINNQLGISGDINTNADLSAKYELDMDDGYSLPGNEVDIGTGSTTTALIGQPFGCFQNNGGEYVYYHVLVER